MSQALAPSVAAAPATPKLRHPAAVVLALFATFGFYGVWWWYAINRDMTVIGRARGTSELGDKPWLSALALVAGAFVVVPAVWTAVTTVRRAQRAQRAFGQQPLNGWLYTALAVGTLGIGAMVYLQSALNRVIGQHLGLDAEEVKQRMRGSRGDSESDRFWNQGSIGSSSTDSSPGGGGFSSFD